ncbi:MAG: hypothetical protein AAGU11_06075 [Syntrophobacteraceae bacterium]
MKKDCVLEGKCYSHGETVQSSGERMVCNNGDWESRAEKTGGGLTIAPGENMSDI